MISFHTLPTELQTLIITFVFEHNFTEGISPRIQNQQLYNAIFAVIAACPSAISIVLSCLQLRLKQIAKTIQRIRNEHVLNDRCRKHPSSSLHVFCRFDRSDALNWHENAGWILQLLVNEVEYFWERLERAGVLSTVGR
jgi:hypothetical protein